MKKQVLLIFTCLAWIWPLIQSPLYAQSVSILSTDTANFPTVSAEIQLNSEEKALERDFKVLDEDKEELAFSLDDISSNEGGGAKGRMIFLLIDASSYTSGPPLENFKQAIMESLRGVAEEGDVYNVGYYGKKRDDGTALRLVEADFTSNVNALRDRVDTKVVSAVDSVDAANTYAVLVEAIDYVEKSPDVGQKMIILLSAAPDNPSSSYSANDIIDQARTAEFPIHTINYKIRNLVSQYNPETYGRISLRTNGITFNALSKPDIINAIGDIFQSPSVSTSKAIQQYRLTFDTKESADGNIHQYTIVYRAEPPTVINYETPNRQSDDGEGNWLQDYGILLIIVAGIVVGIIYWYYNEIQIRRQEELEREEEMYEQQQAELRKKDGDRDKLLKDLQEKNIRLQEQLRSKEQELAKKIDEVPTVMNPEKFDPKNTIIAGGGAAPVLKVSAGAFRNNFYLNKPLITIGRAPNNDIVIPEQTVSSKHATINIQNGSFFLKDLDSTNGTFVNGTRIDQKMLKSGDLIKLGAAQCQFEI